jgi:manganese-transporting P-type ATPase
MRKMADWLDSQSADQDMAGGVPLLKPGDASMASPFTIKAEDVMPATDIIKQGRCTLVTTVQMFKILGLSCLSTAYNLSVLNLAGVKLGDVQVCRRVRVVCM